MKFLLIGPPASGKGAVGERMSKKLEIPVLTVGGLLRSVTPDSPHYKEIHEFMDKGLLAPAGVTAKLLRGELSHEKYSVGFILDGWMRDIYQKDHFDPDVDYAIFINVSDETALKRSQNRTDQREDDTQEILKQRLGLFHSDTMPVIESYRNEEKLIEVDGEPSREEVFAEVLQKLSEKGVL